VTPVTPRTRARLFPNLLLGIGSAVFFLCVAEGVSRMIEAARPERPRAPYITDWAAWDGDFCTVKSTAVGWPPWEDYNRDGLRDREHALAKPPGVRRVVALGDSTTLGWRLRPEEAYPQVLQDRASALGRNLEVFNVALGGWSTRQELIAYRRIARAYRPDLVLLGICLNDFAEMQNNLARPPAWLSALHLHSALVRRIVRAEDREIGSIEELFVDPPSRRVEEGFRRVFADVRSVRDDVKADGAELVVLLLPYRQQVEVGPPAAVPQKRVAEFCAREKIRFLDLLPALRDSGDLAFIDPVHLSASGARRVAETVLQAGLWPGDAGEGDAGASPITTAGTLVARVPPAEALGHLVPALASARPEERAAAARAIGTLGLEAVSALDALTAALDDPAADVRSAAAWAIGGLGPAAAEAAGRLGQLARDDSAAVRAGASWALGRIGPSAQAAVPLLVERLADADETVRWRAGDALGALGCTAA
jgi:lysophospholipase L1-like esterase